MKKGPVFDMINSKPLFANPKSKFQYINTDEVAEIVTKIINREFNNEIFNICGTYSISIVEIFRILGKKSYNNNLKKQTYNINNNKIRDLLDLSTTKETIKDFLEIK